MDFKEIHHVAIIASNLEKTLDFYKTKLELPLIRQTLRKERGDVKLDFKLGTSSELEIFIKEDAPKRPNYPEALGLRHLAFRVENVEKEVEKLAQKGIFCEEIRLDDLTGEKMTFFFDPDGLPLELHE